jgi:hypothetical protein
VYQTKCFGDLTGQVSFTTQGVSDAEIAANTNGFTAIDIENGRLPALAKIETLLTAANLIRGGVLGFSLNNLARIVTPFKANYLARLTGSFQIAQGILYTDDLKSDGKNLDLLIQGNSRLLDGWSKYTITGQMSPGRLGSVWQTGSTEPSALFNLCASPGADSDHPVWLAEYYSRVWLHPRVWRHGQRHQPVPGVFRWPTRRPRRL